MNSEKTAYEAGKARGQAEEKGSQLIDQAASYAKSAQDTVQKAGVQVKESTLGAVDAVKNATGMNK